MMMNFGLYDGIFETIHSSTLSNILRRKLRNIRAMINKPDSTIRVADSQT